MSISVGHMAHRPRTAAAAQSSAHSPGWGPHRVQAADRRRLAGARPVAARGGWPRRDVVIAIS